MVVTRSAVTCGLSFVGRPCSVTFEHDDVVVQMDSTMYW